MNFADIKAALAKPFAPEDLEWRLQNTNKDKTAGFAVPYVTNRAIQDRLDDVVGPENWRNEFKPWHGNGKKEAQICGISIFSEQRREWITKWDGAEDTDIESVKGGLSDSMKRAAVQWGIGRVLYKMDLVWVDVEQRGSSHVIARKERPKLDKAYADMLKKLKLEPAQPGGLQSQITPGGNVGPANGAPDPQAGGNILTMPTARQSAWEYKVLSAELRNGMSIQTTVLTLRGRDGKELKAYRRGAAPDLVPGTELCQVNLTMQQQDSVAFYVLTAYQIMDPANRAA